LSFIFDWRAEDAAAQLAQEPGGAKAVAAFAVEAGAMPDREVFRAVASRARERSGLKGRALFHPIRVAITGAESGPELDLAVPAIDRGAVLGAAAGLVPIKSCAERAREVAELMAAHDASR
jgi:glutamyl/glutaminyl-tRNA synthetase